MFHSYTPDRHSGVSATETSKVSATNVAWSVTVVWSVLNVEARIAYGGGRGKHRSRNNVERKIFQSHR